MKNKPAIRPVLGAARLRTSCFGAAGSEFRRYSADRGVWERVS